MLVSITDNSIIYLSLYSLPSPHGMRVGASLRTVSLEPQSIQIVQVWVSVFRLKWLKLVWLNAYKKKTAIVEIFN